MHDWTLLRERFAELELRPVQRRVAGFLIEGRSTPEIVTLTGLTRYQVKSHVIGILNLLECLSSEAPATRRPGGPDRARRIDRLN